MSLTHPGGFKVITGVLVRERQEGQRARRRRDNQRERHEGVTLLALKMEDGAMSQGMQEASRGWENRETDSALESPKGMQPC